MARIETEQKAAILAEASMGPDVLVAKRHGIVLRTLQKYRKELEDGDEELSRLFTQKKALLEQDWRDCAVNFLRASIGKLEALVQEADKTQIREVAGAIKIVGELQVVKAALNGEQPGAPGQGRAVPPSGASSSPGSEERPTLQ